MTNPSPKTEPHESAPRWTREQIRVTCLAPLVPLLQKRGLELLERDAGNYELPAHPVRPAPSPPMKNPKVPKPIVSLRPKRGYSVTNYDVTPAKTANPVRRHFREKDDGS